MEFPQTVLDAYTVFTQTEGRQDNSGLVNNLRSGLRRYVLPDYGFTVAELRKLDASLARLPLEKFRDAEEILVNAMCDLKLLC